MIFDVDTMTDVRYFSLAGDPEVAIQRSTMTTNHRKQQPITSSYPDRTMITLQHEIETPRCRGPRSRVLFWSLLLLTVVKKCCYCTAFVLPATTIKAKTSGASFDPRPTPTNTQLQPLLHNINNKRRHSSDHTRHYLLALNEPAVIQHFFTSMFTCSMGPVPLTQACVINAIGFTILLQPLSKMLTPSGLLNAFVLGTSLWATLGWKGWSVCVAYLFLGVLVTKIRFHEKEQMGIAEKRGGKRGPENLWYVVVVLGAWFRRCFVSS